MGTGVVRVAVTGVLAGILSVGCVAARVPAGSGAASAAPTSSVIAPRSGAPALTVGRAAWVSVSVATLWHTPDSPRRVDAPALAHPAAIGRWLAAMTLDQRRGLGGRADTQALLGDRVIVVALPATRPAWARVVVPSQPSPLDRRGYPGWVPRRQLTARVPAAATTRATVLSRTAWVRADTSSAPRLLRLSVGTDLPVTAVTPSLVRVVLPSGAVARIAPSAVVVHDAGRPALAATRDSLVRTATRFVGLPYLWSGVSGFGFDCSGLTWLDYRLHGIRIPRDAAPQSAHGRRERPPRRGDLMFYAAHGVVHHVTMYVGTGRMVHSPGTGQAIEVIATSTPLYANEYVGARRYLP